MEKKEMNFGKKFRAGNFEYLKITKTLSKKEMNALRDESKIPSDVRKHLSRGGLPYIVVNTIAGSWSICFVIGTAMYNLIEHNAMMMGDTGEKALENLFMMMYSDTAIVGDQQYWNDKAEALRGYLERTRASEVSQEEDDKELASLKAEEDAKAAIVEMGKEVGHGE